MRGQHHRTHSEINKDKITTLNLQDNAAVHLATTMKLESFDSTMAAAVKNISMADDAKTRSQHVFLSYFNTKTFILIFLIILYALLMDSTQTNRPIISQQLLRIKTIIILLLCVT